ncbi:hypothetical protein [Ochrobactrum sp. Q0168]|uniref:hypothetical protein n=1 Tax=Ochrobactrum sp. Q0168 TaxID=2793241 RepID=UPI0018EB451A
MAFVDCQASLVSDSVSHNRTDRNEPSRRWFVTRGQSFWQAKLDFFVADRGVVRLFDLHVATQHASEKIEGTPIHHAQQICLARVAEFFFGGRQWWNRSPTKRVA